MPEIGVPEFADRAGRDRLIVDSSRLRRLARSLGRAKHAFEEALGRHPPAVSWLDQVPRLEDRVASVDAIRSVHRLDHEKANSR